MTGLFGWTKTVGGGRKLRYVGLKRNQLWVGLTGAAYNLVRIGVSNASRPSQQSEPGGRGPAAPALCRERTRWEASSRRTRLQTEFFSTLLGNFLGPAPEGMRGQPVLKLLQSRVQGALATQKPLSTL